MISFLKRCNGYGFGGPTLSDEAKDALIAVLPLARERFRVFMTNESANGNREYYAGSRFNDDGSVFQRIEHAMDSESEVLTAPMDWALDALRDCAGADHWYTFEKDYGSDYDDSYTDEF